MADFEGAMPIKSVRDDEIKIKIVDGLSGEVATNVLTIDTDGEVGVKIRDEAGDTLNINPDGSINVALTEGNRVPICDFSTAVAVAKDAVSEFDYLITDLKKFTGFNVLVGSRGATKVEVGTYDGTTFVPKALYFQLPAQNRTTHVPAIVATGDGDLNIRVRVTNLDNATDISVAIMGYEE